MNKMGGAISLTSKVGEGSKFTVKIPVVAPEKK
jgi:signal transduction histidine kinase